MAKDIKAVQCPHCGSVYKTETKPDFYRCQNCNTEYFINSDDVHIYHHHQQAPPVQSSAPPGNTKLPVYILIGAVLFIVVIYLVAMFFQPKKSPNYNNYSTYKTPRMYRGTYVFTNAVTGNPVYLRLGTDQIDKGNNKTEQELHAQFNDALTGELIADRLMPKDIQCDDIGGPKFKVYSPELIYAVGCENKLLQLDAKNNQLTEVTQTVFSRFPELSSGIARLEFDYYKPMIKVMSNEGNSYYYFPSSRKLINDEEQANKVWKTEFDKHYFEFGYMGSFFDHGKDNQLIENTYTAKTGKLIQRNLTPGRKYFDPKILYQDNQSLLISVNTTAASNPPISVQNIDVKTGKIKWALPPDKYYLYTVSKWKNGFAIEYRKDQEADYVHGVMVVSNTGKLINNYQLGRTE